MLFSLQTILQLRKKVEALLTRTYSTAVLLKRDRFIHGHLNICRFLVLAGPTELGSSIIVKQLRAREKNPMHETSYPSSRWLFFNDWAGLQFLQQTIVKDCISPRLYVADREAGILVIEDLNPLADIGTLLRGGDAQQAQSTLIQMGAVLGKLHASTIGKQEIFEHMRDMLAPREPSWGWVPPWQRIPATYYRLLQTLPPSLKEQGFTSFQWMPFVLRRAAAFLSLSFSAQVEAELEVVIRALSAPGPFLAYTHGDPCPENCLLVENTLKLVDFENGAYRHVLIDAVYGRMCFPTCWSANQTPDSIVEKMEQCYRSELVKGCPEAADDFLFAQALVQACAYWAIMLCQFEALPELTVKDAMWGPTSMLQRILVRFERFAHTTKEFSYLEDLGNLFQHMATALRERWPVGIQPLPLYPVFQDEHEQ